MRGVRGGGNIIGVIQMINKKNGQDFDKNDEDALLACVQRIADVLSAKFNDLLTVADRFAGRHRKL